MSVNQLFKVEWVSKYGFYYRMINDVQHPGELNQNITISRSQINVMKLSKIDIGLIVTISIKVI